MVELLKQGQYRPYNVIDQVISIYAGTKGYLDDIPISQVPAFEDQLLKHFRDEFPEVRSELESKKELTGDLDKKLGEIVTNFKTRFKQA